MVKLSIIIPVYNEVKTISEIIKRINGVNFLSSLKYEIIVVDDGSKDGTTQLLNNLKENNKMRLFISNKNMGKGYSIRKGIEVSSGEIILIQDADLEYDPNDYKKLLEPIINDNIPIIYGSRNIYKIKREYSGVFYYAGGLLLTWLTNFLYPGAKITDEATCYKVFKKSTLNGIRLRCRGFEFCPEITAKFLKNGFKIKEVPISYIPRAKNEGKKINWKDGIIGVWTLIKYRFID